MGTWKRWTRAVRGAWRGEPRSDADGAPAEPDAGDDAGPAPLPRGGLAGWVEKRAKQAVLEAYETSAADLQERAQRAMSSAYERTADDLEERAVRAMRRALEAEADRIKDAIEHGIAVKKREVRLSLLVLIVSSLVYLALYWFAGRTPGP